MQKLKDYKYLMRQIEDTLNYLDNCQIEAKNKDWGDGVQFAKAVLLTIIESCCGICSIDYGDWRNDREE